MTKKIIPVLFYIFLFAAELAAILYINHGRFIYTLDDTYIHLSLAENILHGHYGVNLNEYASPSSSIIWPFILAPFTFFSGAEYVPLILNFIFSILTIFFFGKIIDLIFSKYQFNNKNNILTFFTCLLVLCCNLVNLTFCGMEHSLHVFIISITVLELIKLLESGNLSKTMLIMLVLSPLVRYEGLAVSIPILMFIFYKGFKKESLICFFSIVILLFSFSLFLNNLGLPALPLSIKMKTTERSRWNSFLFPIQNLIENLSAKRIWAMAGLILILLYGVFQQHKKESKVLAAVIIMSSASFFLLFRTGGFFRYELFMWTFFMLLLFYYYSKKIDIWINIAKDYSSSLFISLVLLFFSSSYVIVLLQIPYASSNIYEQQYQMHRFAVDYYKAPIAIVDLGWVSYKNDEYIMDLLGLGSKEVYELSHLRIPAKEWIPRLVKEHNIKLLMCYPNSNIPAGWVHAAKLSLRHEKTSAGGPEVEFIITDSAFVPSIVQKLKTFKATLPPGVPLQIMN